MIEPRNVSAIAPSRYKAAIIDLDGTLIYGRSVRTGARELLARFAPNYVIASNNSTHTSAELSSMLARLGLEVPSSRIILAGTTAIGMVACQWPDARVLLIASASLRRQAEAFELRLTDEMPDLVLLARDPDFTYAKLVSAVNAVANGARLVVTNPDLSHPGNGSTIVPETGSLLQALLACVQPKDGVIIGKPEPHLFTEALGRLGVPASDCVVIGDNRHTDGAGAQRLGMAFIEIGHAHHHTFPASDPVMTNDGSKAIDDAGRTGQSTFDVLSAKRY